jgi:hypothetical protein
VVVVPVVPVVVVAAVVVVVVVVVVVAVVVDPVVVDPVVVDPVVVVPVVVVPVVVVPVVVVPVVVVSACELLRATADAAKIPKPSMALRLSTSNVRFIKNPPPAPDLQVARASDLVASGLVPSMR